MIIAYIISWEQLSIYIFCFLIIYYPIVLAMFFRRDITQIAGRFKGFNQERLQKQEVDINESVNNGNESDKLYNSVHDLMEDLKTIFKNITNAPFNKEKLVKDLNSKVQRYPHLYGTAFQVSLTNHIEQESENRLGIKLTDEELDSIWK